MIGSLNPSDFWQFSLFVGLIIVNLNNIVNNLDRFEVFLEYPNSYPNWVAHLGAQRFQLIRIFTKTIISPCFRQANDTKSKVQCIVKVFKVFKVLFRTNNIHTKNRNWLSEKFLKLCLTSGGEWYLVPKEEISWKKLKSGSTLLWTKLSFIRKRLKREDSQSTFEAIVYSIKNLSNGIMRIGNDVKYNSHSCLDKQ